MNLRIPAFLIAIILLACAASAQVSAKHASVELLSRDQGAAPGSDLMLGVHFLLEKGWHIYWINPGDSGQPPTLNWQLPTGFSVGEVEWPRPERMQPSPTLADYGYHDDVLLMIPVKVAASVAKDRPAEFVLDAKWLICREVCLPDRAQLKLSLPLARSAQTSPATAHIFARTQKLLPISLPKGWRVSAQSLKNSFVLVVHSGKALSKAEFFPLDPDQIDNAAPQKIEPAAAGLRISLKKSDLLVKRIFSLRGVLVIGDRAYQVEAPVTAPRAVK
ncbi:MAG TPA: protein-disulfide reductase DsbD domain-containing protein [Terriglobales bacterium]|nr:protein-disulfide reductase DsbD domain-containing protein [Terriglobales bacterium]